nr:hypothetical protein [Tanacetum cinerariifolium]
MVENVIAAGSKNRHPMLGKGMLEDSDYAIYLRKRERRNYTTKKTMKDCEWFKDKMLLAQAQEAARSNFKADHVDAYDLDYDDEATTNAIFMENFSPVGPINDETVEPHYDSGILYVVPHYDTYHEFDVLNYDIQELEYIENIVSNNESYDELTSNNNVISYADYMVTIGNDEDNYVPLPVQNNDRILEKSTKGNQMLQLQHEGHIAKQYTTKKTMKDCEWFKDKMLLAQAQGVGVVLNDEQHDFLADSLEETDNYEDP